jgi:hypothetical protein
VTLNKRFTRYEEAVRGAQTRRYRPLAPEAIGLILLETLLDTDLSDHEARAISGALVKAFMAGARDDNLRMGPECPQCGR